MGPWVWTGRGNVREDPSTFRAMASASQSPGLIQRYREELQVRHYARRTVNTYEQWLRRFLRFHRKRHPRERGSAEVNAFLSHLAVELQVSASTQNQALAALLFLYRELLERDLELEGVVRARTRRRLPVVLSEAEVRAVRQRLEGEAALVVGLLYGSGLRLMEALRLRVKDLDFQRRELAVRDGKGGMDRLTLLPQSLVPELQEHLLKVRQLHQGDLVAGWGSVLMPSHHPGTPGPSGPEHHHDLHPCAQPRAAWGLQPSGHDVAMATGGSRIREPRSSLLGWS
jgi:site-specific recombinase XerD